MVGTLQGKIKSRFLVFGILFTALCCFLSSVLHCISITGSSAKMPWYDVEHAIALTESQCDVLAEKITSLHTRTFMVPALLVNIQFRDASKDNTYVAGKRKLSNRIQANLRVGPGRPIEMYDDLAEQLERTWYDVVGIGRGKELRAVLINGGRLTGREAGFVISPASGIGRETGDGPNWFEQNLPEIKKRADEGDEEMLDLLEEMRTRDDVKK